jgi:hypothetical protein
MHSVENMKREVLRRVFSINKKELGIQSRIHLDIKLINLLALPIDFLITESRNRNVFLQIGTEFLSTVCVERILK